MKAENLKGLDGVNDGEWMCGVTLKDRNCSMDLYSLLGIQSVCGGCDKAWQIEVVWASEA